MASWLALASCLIAGVPNPSMGDTHGTESPNRVSLHLVRLVIDYGDGVEKHFTKIPWREGMTVADVLHAASAHARGITYRTRGKEATAFLYEIDGQANGGANAKNWIFRVNDRLATQGFARTAVKGGDAVLWKFETYE